MIFAVIDTNVFVSALLTKHRDSATAKVVEAVLDGRITALKSPEIISEYREVLARPHFQFPEGTVTRILATVETDGIDLSAQSSPEEFSDESDRIFFEVALAGATLGTKLVTGNLKHYPTSPIVITPSQMVALLDSSCQ